MSWLPVLDVQQRWGNFYPECMGKINFHIPTHNRSAYFFYSEEVRGEFTAGNLRYSGWRIGQIIMKQYKALSDEERVHWDKKAANDRERYEKEMAVFKKVHGCVAHQTPFFMFTNSVGSDIEAANPPPTGAKSTRFVTDNSWLYPTKRLLTGSSSLLLTRRERCRSLKAMHDLAISRPSDMTLSDYS